MAKSEGVIGYLKEMNHDVKFFIGLLLVLSVWFIFGYGAISEWMSQNFLIAYSAFILIFVSLMMYFVLDINPLTDVRHFISLLLVWLAFDILSFPLLVTPTGLVTQEINAKMSSDVFVYSLLPALPSLLKFWVTYVLVPSIMLIVARILVGSKKFYSAVETSI